jgi:hypothetical protein
MKNIKRILTMLMAVLLLCGTMNAFADVEKAPGTACTVNNADEEAALDIYRSYTLNVGERKQIIPNQSSSTGRFNVTMTCSDPNIVEIKGKRSIVALAPGRCIVTATVVFDWSQSRPKVLNFDITVVGGPMLAANGKMLKDDDVVRMKVRKTLRLEVKYLKALWVKSWSCSDPSMLKIVTGKKVCSFIPLKPGICTITVRLYGGMKFTCRVVVTA